MSSKRCGAISVQSEPGTGSSFEILFPCIEQLQRDTPKQAGKLPRGHEKIFFVDDEISMVELNQQRLERLGYAVEIRTNPVEALDLFRSEPDRFDLIITDMTMPGLTGDKLSLEALKIRPDIPIILCTGYSEKISEERAEELGIRKYLEKPLTKETLAKSVREVLNGNETEAEVLNQIGLQETLTT
jgi:CheY-like chemotaxis protein